MDIGKSLSYMFDDENWLRKILIGGLIGLVPILNLALTGYILRTLKNVLAGAARPLPEWDDLGSDMVKGLLVTVAGMVYSLPLIILVFLFVGAMGVGGAFSAGGGREAGEAAAVLGSLGSIGIMCLTVPYVLLVAVWMPAAMANYARSDGFGAFFRLGEIWGLIRRNAGNYVIVLLVALVANQIAGWLGALALIVGAAFTGFWANLVYGHLLGQFLREDAGATLLAP